MLFLLFSDQKIFSKLQRIMNNLSYMFDWFLVNAWYNARGSFRLSAIAQSFLQVEISADIDIPSSRLDSGHQFVLAIEKISK